MLSLLMLQVGPEKPVLLNNARGCPFGSRFQEVLLRSTLNRGRSLLCAVW